MEEEIKRLNDRHDKLKFELEDKTKKAEQVRGLFRLEQESTTGYVGDVHVMH